MIQRVTIVRCAAAMLIVCAGGAAQTVDGPQLGFIVDQSGHGLHRVLGVEGAAVTAPEVSFPPELTPLAVSPRGNYVLVLAGEEQGPAVWSTAGTHTRIPIGERRQPDAVALSPEGTAAALYYRSYNEIVTLSGLPDSPVRHGVVRTSRFDEEPSAFAVSDDGELILTRQTDVSPDGSAASGSLIVSGTASEITRLRFFGAVGPMAFRSGSHDVIVAAGSEAFLIRDVDTTATLIPLRTESLGAVSAVAVSPDGAQAFLAGASSGKIASFRLDTAAPVASVTTCACAPRRLARMGSGTLYQLTPFDGSVSWMLDVSTGSPRALAVPTATNPEQ